MGKNALTIHYTRNSDEIHPEDMVLVDAGGVSFLLSTRIIT